MQIQTYLFSNNKWNNPLDSTLDSLQTLVIVFGSTKISTITEGIANILAAYSEATVIGCSTSGEIYGSEVYDDSLSVAVVRFNKSTFKLIVKDLQEKDSFEIGKSITDTLGAKDLKSIFLLCDTLSVDGSELSRGLSEHLPKECVIFGGLAGDGVEFNKTWIIVDGAIVKKNISAVGLYGKDLKIHHGCKCGWSRFGIERKVTSSRGNILYTLDNKPALELYKRYLGPYAFELPASALHFPLMILKDGESDTIDDFRTFFQIDKATELTSFCMQVKSVLNIIGESLVNKKIELKKDLHCKSEFMTYSNELKHVIINIIKNAEDALVENNIKNPLIEIKTYKKADKRVLQISDNAGGIPEELLDKIFDPYFSTKSKKSGTGLGLYMSKIIVEDHCNGILAVHNEGEKCVFEIIFPL